MIHHCAMAVTVRSTVIPVAANTSAAGNLRVSVIRCGSRDNRGPLMKGRILSTEAIQAIQALKRSHRATPTSFPTHILSRLIKSDLMAAYNELLRQDQCTLALQVFSTVRAEYQADLTMYADLVSALAKNGLTDEIDRLTDELERDCEISNHDNKGLLKLVKTVINDGRRESTVRIYGMLKRSGWGSPSFEVDEYLGKVLRNGLRRFGETELADEIAEKLHESIPVKSRD